MLGREAAVIGREAANRATKSREVDLSRLKGFHLRFAPKMRSQVGPCVIRPFHFQFRKKMKFYFLFVLFIISSRFFETKLPYCRINADILNTKLELLLYLT